MLMLFAVSPGLSALHIWIFSLIPSPSLCAQQNPSPPLYSFIYFRKLITLYQISLFYISAPPVKLRGSKVEGTMSSHLITVICIVPDLW